MAELQVCNQPKFHIYINLNCPACTLGSGVNCTGLINPYPNSSEDPGVLYQASGVADNALSSVSGERLHKG